MEWTLTRHALTSSRVTTSTVSASHVWAWPTSVSSVALVRTRRGESCLTSLTCIMRFPGLGSSLSPPASLMRRPLTSPTSLVLWSRGTSQSRRSRTCSLRTSCRLPPPHGSPALSFRPSHVEPPLYLLGKSCMAAGQAGVALHTMAILQAYQAEVLM